ncbi:hypothetical protein E1262_17450 [Jiangella aurantiaca]|uniref:GNAT family N-acetyltransferase n=1 Tax=Jiangella aurantiaca TaxID=2530373 RepID=A0A4R5AA74_9ACTN|nr:hypothetical protein [Jiangella aurantiaca]TDD67996.1 hypothetical protein E1262_17450 [Jiangella aurantiaca]
MPANVAAEVRIHSATALSTSLAYVGTTGMFERAGFTRVAGADATSARRPRWIMRRDLAGAARV